MAQLSGKDRFRVELNKLKASVANKRKAPVVTEEKHTHTFKLYKHRVHEDISSYHGKTFYFIYGECECGYKRIMDYKGV